MLIIAVTSYFIYKNAQASKVANQLLALKSLRSQMNPHFIFNALNSVNHFIAQQDERTANKFLSEFSQLMRLVLENSQEDFIPLEREQEILSLYLKLEHYRFRDKFNYDIKIDDHLLAEAIEVPPMLIQPYIENAVWHGLRYKEAKGNLTLRFRKEADNLVVEITDDGIGRTKSSELKTENQKKHHSTGLKNIQERLAIINKVYKANYRVSIEDLENTTGTRVRIYLPVNHPNPGDTMNAVIIDDEKDSRQILMSYLGKYCPDVTVCGFGESVASGLEVIKNTQPDIVFLDIEMPYGNGFDLLDKVDNVTFETVFVTAFDNYAIQALNQSEAYYLLKPIDIDELVKAVEKIKHERKAENYTQHTRILLENFKAGAHQKIMLPTLEGFEIVTIHSILYCQAVDNFTRFYFESGTPLLICRTLKYFENILKEHRFLRIHRSHLINPEYVIRYNRGNGGSVTMTNNQELEISPNKKKEFLELFER